MALILNFFIYRINLIVCLSCNGKYFFSIELVTDKWKPSDYLYSFIYYTFKSVILNIYSINAICLTPGPVAYTGLRVVTSSVKGLCYGLKIPLIAINTLAVLVQTVKINKGILIPMIDAPSNKVYTALFNHKKQRISPIMSVILNKNYLKEYLVEDLFILGDGARKAKDLIKIPFKYIFQSGPYSKNMVYLSECAFKNKNFENIDFFEPIYL